jgi:hypothetical protein
LVGISIVVAAASWKLVEEPFRRARLLRPRRSSFVFASSAICVVLVAAQLMGVLGASSVAAGNIIHTDPDETQMPDAITATQISSLPNEVTAAPESVTQASSPTPSPTMAPVPHELRPRLSDVRRDVDGLNERGCGLSLAGSQPPLCTLGIADGAITVALVGDSHAAQWFPALEVIAQQRGWKILPFTKDSCIFLDMRIVSLHLEREYTECARWRDQVVIALQRAQPDLVVVSSSRWVHPVDPADADPQRQSDAMVRLLKALAGRVAIIADTPLSAVDVPACLSRPDRTAADCATACGYALTAHLARDGRAAAALGATLIDPTQWLCGADVCPAVIDWTIVYRDDHHLTATMARRLAPLLDSGLMEAISAVH